MLRDQPSASIIDGGRDLIEVGGGVSHETGCRQANVVCGRSFSNTKLATVAFSQIMPEFCNGPDYNSSRLKFCGQTATIERVVIPDSLSIPDTSRR